MQTCSNCGSVSRDGAKFCTTCGSRLNEVVDTTQSTGWVAYESSEPETADAPEPPAAVDASDETMASPAVTEKPVNISPDTSSAPTPPPSWAWGQSATTAKEEPAPEISEPVIETTADTSSDDAAVDEAVPDEVNAPSPASPEPDAPAEPIVEEPKEESLSSWANQWSTDENSDDNDEAPAPVSVQPEPAATRGSSNAIDYIAAQEIDTDVDAEVGPVDLTAMSAFDNALNQSPSPKERAQTLVDQLRDLIAESFDAGVTETVSPVIPAGSDGDALATLNALPADDGTFDSLRAILQGAKEHPRDVDTMLNLLGEINGLIALVDSHQRYVDAVETAKQQLS